MHHQQFSRIPGLIVAGLLAASVATSSADPIPMASSQQAEASVQEPVARVNGLDIPAARLKRAVDSLIATKPGAQLSPETLRNINLNVLQDLISQELFYQAGMKLEIKDLDKQVMEKVDSYKARVDADDYNRALKSKGMTEKDVYDNARRDIVIANFIARTIDAKISVTEEECKKVYDQNIDRFTQPEQVRIHHILIEVTAKMSADEKKKAREKAEKILKELLKGADFDEMARKYSNAADSKLGGDLGYFSRDKLPLPLAQAAFALKPGQLSDIVESKAGYDIIKLRDHKDAVTKPFEEAKPGIESFLRKLKSDAAIQEFLKEAREKAKVEVLLK